jgi:hypothetical protein
MLKTKTKRTRDKEREQSHTCGSVKSIPGQAARPARSCSMYSNTRYKLQDILEVTNPSNFTTLG